MIASGALGDILSFHSAYLHSSYIGTKRPFAWRLDHARSGGGAMMDLGSHAADMIIYLTGEQITKVQAMTRTVTPQRQKSDGTWADVTVDDEATVMAELAGGGRGIIEASRIATGTADELTFVIRGTKGAIRWNLMEPNWLEYFDETATWG